MDAPGSKSAHDWGGAPRLLEHCAAFERMNHAAGQTARDRLDLALGWELAGLLCRALTRGQRPHASLAV